MRPKGAKAMVARKSAAGSEKIEKRVNGIW
jgi:hypothetical protein